MSLNTILNNKEKIIDDLLDVFNTQWEKMVPDLQKSLISLFKQGEYSANAIQVIFQEFGFDDLAGNTAAVYNKMFKLSEEVSKELGYKFILTEDNRALFAEMNNLNVETLLNTRAQIATDLKRFAIEARLEGRSVANIRRGLEMTFDNMGRRLNTEIITGIRSYESAIDLTSMLNGGITRFKYVGPLDGKTRDICTSTLTDPRNDEGFTLAEVESSQTPFIERGGWNCRHRWIAVA